MLALLNWFRPSPPGWSKLTTLEGVKALFPSNPTRNCSLAMSPLGEMSVTVYSAQLQGSNFSAVLSIRDFMPGNEAQAEDYFKDWKREFNQTMDAYGIQKTLVKQRLTLDGTPRLDLLYANADETVFTRVSLLNRGTRLVVLFAVGMLQEISGPACSDCFHSIRL